MATEVIKLDHRKWKRNATLVHQNIRETQDNKLVALADCKIYIPVRYDNANLSHIGENVSIIGIYAIVFEDQFYAVSNITAMVSINPYRVQKVKFDGDEYYEFTFLKNQIFIKNTDLVKNNEVIYSIFNEFISKGNVPWFIEYEDYGRIFDTAKYHAGSNIAKNPELTQLLVAMQSRSKQDRNVYYRQVIEDYKELKTNPPDFVPLKSVIFSASNTLNKLAGSYFGDGVVSALVNPTERVERIEELIRA